jgi:NTP pyrophosphatase (non-canonical NTP hydrolase)
MAGTKEVAAVKRQPPEYSLFSDGSHILCKNAKAPPQNHFLEGLFIKNSLSMTIQEAQNTVDQWINTIGVRYYSELTNTALLMEEVGEVARLMARIYGEQSFKNPADAADAPAQLADEMADVLFLILCLANQTGIDLTEALQKNLDKKTKRDAARHAGTEKLR